MLASLYEVCRRLELIAQHYQVTRPDLVDQGLHVICRVDQDSVLGQLDRTTDRIVATPLFHQFKAEDAKLKTVLVVIDTAADTFDARCFDSRIAISRVE